MKRIFLFVSIISASCGPTKYLRYNEIKNNLRNSDISTVLIVGTGTSGTNLFVESISEELNKRLKSKNIKTVYHHLGNQQAEANRLFRELITLNKYDAVLHFAQLDATKDPIRLSSGSGVVPLAGGSSMAYSYQYRQIRFEQQFLMRLFEFADLSNSLVEVKLEVNIDFINPQDYSKLSTAIIRSLKME